MRGRRALPLLLCAAVLLTYAPAWRCGFVGDDHLAIERGRLIGSLSNVPQLYLHDTMYNSLGERHERTAKVNSYRPLTMTTFFVEHAIFGADPRPYHVTSVLIHAANVLLLRSIGLALGLGHAGSAIAALLFGVHPAIAEAVYWVNGRSDPLFLLFFLAALRAWLRGLAGPSPSRLILCGGLFFLATLCKETAFTLLPPLLLLAWRRSLGVRRRLLALAPWAAGATLAVALRLLVLRGAAAGTASDLLYGARRLPLLWLHGLRSLVLPDAEVVGSLFERYHAAPAAAVALAASLLTALAVACLWSWRRGATLAPWAAAVLLCSLAPVALLTSVEGWAGWGRYLYPSAAALALAAGAAVPKLAQARPRLRLAAGAAVGILLCHMGAECWLAGRMWRSDRSLALGQIEHHPEISVAYSVLSEIELNEGHPERALALAMEAVRRAPAENHQHFVRLAWALNRLGRAEESYAAADRALARAPDDPGARYIKALQHLDTGRQRQAATALLSLLAEDATFQGPWLTLSSTVARLGTDSEFVAALRDALPQVTDPELASRLRALIS